MTSEKLFALFKDLIHVIGYPKTAKGLGISCPLIIERWRIDKKVPKYYEARVTKLAKQEGIYE